jgi:hypothetical protein
LQRLAVAGIDDRRGERRQLARALDEFLDMRSLAHCTTSALRASGQMRTGDGTLIQPSVARRPRVVNARRTEGEPCRVAVVVAPQHRDRRAVARFMAARRGSARKLQCGN